MGAGKDRRRACTYAVISADGAALPHVKQHEGQLLSKEGQQIAPFTGRSVNRQCLTTRLLPPISQTATSVEVGDNGSRKPQVRVLHSRIHRSPRAFRVGPGRAT